MTNFNWQLDCVGMRHLDNVFFAHLMEINVAILDRLLNADFFVMNLLTNELFVNFAHLFGLFVALNLLFINVLDFFNIFVVNVATFVQCMVIL